MFMSHPLDLYHAYAHPSSPLERSQIHPLPFASTASSSRTQVHVAGKDSDVELGGAITDSDEKDLSKSLSVVVTLDKDEDPQQRSTIRKWIIVFTISISSLCLTTASSIAAFTETSVGEEFHVSHIVTVLSVSLFVLGLAIGPLFIGPISETHGRSLVYNIAYGLFFIFTFPVAFAPNIATYLVFRFLSGFCSSAFLSIAGGSISDLFDNAHVASPMAVYTLASFVGPEFGPFIGGFINQYLYWRWTWRIMLIWNAVQWLLILFTIPETYVPLLERKKMLRLQKKNPLGQYTTSHDYLFEGSSVLGRILVSIRRPAELALFEPMALLLSIWTGLILSILYLSFQAFPIIFESPLPPLDESGRRHYDWVSASNSAFNNIGGTVYGHAFSVSFTGMTFLGIAIGMIGASLTQSWWNKYQASRKCSTPEAQLTMAEVGAVLIPMGLYILAFTSYPSLPWIAPILGSVPFGWGMYYVFMSVFTYLVIGYRPIAASALAENTAMRCSMSAVLPLFAKPMYNRMGTVGATAFLAGVMTVMAPMPFVFRRIGARLRRAGRYGVKD